MTLYERLAMNFDESSLWTDEDMIAVTKIIDENPHLISDEVLTIVSTPKGFYLFATIYHRIKEEYEH